MMETISVPQEELRKEVVGKKHLFLAAPFFNHQERGIVSQIEDIADQAGVPFFSAMREPPNTLQPEQYADPAVLQEINSMCIRGLEKSFAMLAWLDRIQPAGDEVMLIHRPKTIGNSERPGDKLQIVDGIVKKRNLVKTDDGVMWEMGFAACLLIPVFGFTLREDLENVNPMISQNVMAIARGWDDLYKLFEALGGINSMERVLAWAERANGRPTDFRLPPR